MLRGFKGKAIVLAGAGVIGGGAMAYQAYDLKMHYTVVDAKIMSVKTECFIKSGKEKIVTKGTSNLAYMDCEIAPLVARQEGMDESAVHERVTVTYDYRSPVDDRMHSGQYSRTGNTKDLIKGRVIRVHAHNTLPDVSRTTKANFFVEDTGT
ncbi:hypothetical protein [Roseibium sp.]|uniref:hypothetical protein n=1 Tax=Roseibium sp. TaxID=1936156 RepID=UPI003D1002CD